MNYELNQIDFESLLDTLLPSSSNKFSPKILEIIFLFVMFLMTLVKSNFDVVIDVIDF